MPTEISPTATVPIESTNTPTLIEPIVEPKEMPTLQGDPSPIAPRLDTYPPPHQTSPLPSPLETPISGALAPYWDIAAVDLAIADLAERLGEAPDSIKVLEIAPDEFPGGDLGCPNPKEEASISPSIVTGYRVTLEVNSSRYEYHTRKGNVVFCRYK
jgi:hypothetical protein